MWRITTFKKNVSESLSPSFPSLCLSLFQPKSTQTLSKWLNEKERRVQTITKVSACQFGGLRIPKHQGTSMAWRPPWLPRKWVKTTLRLAVDIWDCKINILKEGRKQRVLLFREGYPRKLILRYEKIKVSVIAGCHWFEIDHLRRGEGLLQLPHEEAQEGCSPLAGRREGKSHREKPKQSIKWDETTQMHPHAPPPAGAWSNGSPRLQTEAPIQLLRMSRI